MIAALSTPEFAGLLAAAVTLIIFTLIAFFRP